MTDAPLIAGVELGGTKIICILARGPGATAEEALDNSLYDVL
jgi:fructokinase